MLVFTGLIWAAFKLLPLFFAKSETYESWSINKSLKVVNLADRAAVLRGNNNAKAFSANGKKIDLLIKEILEKEHPKELFKAHSNLYTAAIFLKKAAEKSAKNQDYLFEITMVKSLLEDWKAVVKDKFALKKKDLMAIDFDLAKAIPKPPETPKPTRPLRRGTGIASFSTIPKPITYESSLNTYYYAPTDLLAATIEVENQGEVEETSVAVTLILRSSLSGKIAEVSTTIDSLKPKERKPVTFQNLLPDPALDAENVLKVIVTPVSGEKYIFNNERVWRIRWKRI